MPLSEEEQRILREIEEHLSATDPELVRSVGADRSMVAAGRRLRWALVGVVLCLAASVVLLGTHVALSFAAFVGAFVCGVRAERAVREVGRAGIATILEPLKRFAPGQPTAPGAGQRGSASSDDSEPF